MLPMIKNTIYLETMATFLLLLLFFFTMSRAAVSTKWPLVTDLTPLGDTEQSVEQDEA